MALQLFSPLDPSSFQQLLGMNAGQGLDANNAANAQNAAWAQANPQHGLKGILGALGLGPSPMQEGQAQAQVAAAQQAAAEAARQRQQQQAGDAAIQAVLQDPSPANVARAVTLNPQHATALKDAHDVLDAEDQRMALSRMSALQGRIAANDIPGAKALLQENADADRAAGRDASADEAALKALDSPEGATAALGALRTQLASIMGPEKYAAYIKATEPPNPFEYVNTSAGVVRGNKQTGESGLVYTLPEKPPWPGAIRDPNHPDAWITNPNFIAGQGAVANAKAAASAAHRAPPRGRTSGGGGINVPAPAANPAALWRH